MQVWKVAFQPEGDLTGTWELTIDKLPPGRFVSLRFLTSNGTNAQNYIKFASGKFLSEEMMAQKNKSDLGTNEMRFFFEGEYQFRTEAVGEKSHFFVPIVFDAIPRRISSLNAQPDVGHWRSVYLNYQ